MKKDLSKMNKKLLAAVAIAAAAVIPGLDQRLAVRRYTIKTHKLKRCARLVLRCGRSGHGAPRCGGLRRARRIRREPGARRVREGRRCGRVGRRPVARK